VSHHGGLQLCLFGEGRHSLRHLLQTTSQKDELKDEVMRVLALKKESHFLQDGIHGSNQTFSAIGG